MISIVIPAYNEEKYIKKTIDSIKSQSFDDYEIISVLNGCTDSTKNQAKDSKIIELNERNVSKARNEGAKIAKGSILMFLDADTLLTNSSLEEINKLMQRTKIATCKSLPDENKLSFNLWHKLKTSLYFFNWPSGVLILDSQLLNKVQGFNEKITKGEHSNLIKRARKYSNYKQAQTYVINSTRRYSKWGYLKIVLFWIKERLFHPKKEYPSIR